MSNLPIRSLFKIVMEKKSSKRFLLATIFSFAFSMTVILGTIGLMDGFEVSLKKALSHSNGDIKFTSNDGFFVFNDELKDSLETVTAGEYSSLLQLESFALVNGISKGVLFRGVEKEQFQKITSLNTSVLNKGVLVGIKFKEKFDLKIGDEIVMAFASKKAKGNQTTFLETFSIDGFIEHGIYEKDFRYIYIDKSILESIVGYKAGTSNAGLLKLAPLEEVNQTVKELNLAFEDKLLFKPFWSEFSTLLDAVEVEKYSISLILQLIVVVAILNIMGFIIFISETKAQDFFMLRALGLSLKLYKRFWAILLFSIWILSCFAAQGMIFILDRVILNLPFLKVPGDIYVLSQFRVSLDYIDYIYVYGLSYVWVFLIGFFIMKRQSKKSVLSGLRQEFT